jgi:hypothetical protein
MMRYIICLFAVVFFFTSCNYNTAFKYSQNIVKMEDSLVPYLQKTELDLSRFMASNTYDSITIVAEEMESRISKTTENIKNIPAPDAKGGKEFKEACVDYFEFLKNVYTSYKDFGMQTTDEGRNEVRNKWAGFGKEKDRVMSNMQSAQKKFAEDNGFSRKGDN